jgi:dipeptidyl aminopeptidase/acylaminoacyl peptidase
MYYEALIENKVSATMHIYPTGGHGFGWGDNYIYKSEWASELERWFNTVVFVDTRAALKLLKDN